MEFWLQRRKLHHAISAMLGITDLSLVMGNVMLEHFRHTKLQHIFTCFSAQLRAKISKHSYLAFREKKKKCVLLEVFAFLGLE